MLPRIRAGYWSGPQPLARRRRARCEFFLCLAFVAGLFLPATAVPANSGCVRDAQFRELLKQEMNLPIGVRANAYEETPKRFPGLKDFNTFRRAFPHPAWPRLPLRDAYPSQHDLTFSREEYGRAYQLDRRLPTLNFRVGFLNFRQGNYAAVRQQFQRKIALDPAFGEAYLYLGATLRRQGENSQSLPILRRAVAYDPNNPSAYRELAAAGIPARKFPGAFRTLQEGQQLLPKESAFPRQPAQLLEGAGHPRAAAKQSQLAGSPSRESNVLIYGRLRQEEASKALPQTPEPRPRPPARGKGEGSAAAKAEVSSWPPVQAEASLAAGASVRRVGTFASPQVQQLSQCMERSNRRCVSNALNAIHGHNLEHDPDYLNLKAQALNLLQERAKALAAIQQAIRLQPNQEEYYITEGRIDQGMDNQKAAIQSFLYAAGLRPDAAGPIYDIGMSFFLLGNDQNDTHYYDRAGKHFKLALQLDPKDDRARFMLGVVAVSKFELTEAHEDFEQALQLSPRNAYYHLYLGVLLRRMGNRSAAVRELLAAERLDPSNARAYFNLGALYAQAGRDKAARKQLERAVQLDPKFAPAFYSLGLVYRNLRLSAKAHESFQRFQQLKSRQQQ
ncbi:MAG: tetratricopeptide repeat protein [Terriglobia bacterium]